MSDERWYALQQHADAIEVALRMSPSSLDMFIMKPDDEDFVFHAAAQHNRGHQKFTNKARKVDDIARAHVEHSPE